MVRDDRKRGHRAVLSVDLAPIPAGTRHAASPSTDRSFRRHLPVRGTNGGYKSVGRPADTARLICYADVACLSHRLPRNCARSNRSPITIGGGGGFHRAASKKPVKVVVVILTASPASDGGVRPQSFREWVPSGPPKGRVSRLQVVDRHGSPIVRVLFGTT
jgi:hypothetical protein